MLARDLAKLSRTLVTCSNAASEETCYCMLICCYRMMISCFLRLLLLVSLMFDIHTGCDLS